MADVRGGDDLWIAVNRIYHGTIMVYLEIFFNFSMIKLYQKTFLSRLDHFKKCYSNQQFAIINNF